MHRPFNRISLILFRLNHERNSPLDTYACGQGLMRKNPHETSFRPFCTVFYPTVVTGEPERTKTLFERQLEEYGIVYHIIRAAMPRQNGKAERQHRTDEQRSYKKMKMYDLEDGRKQYA